jgi:hypothetical protein
MSRDQISQSVTDKHERRRITGCKTISQAEDPRDALETVIRALPGVANDPETVSTIMMFVDTYAAVI